MTVKEQIQTRAFRLQAIISREVKTVWRTRTYFVLGIAFIAVIIGLAHSAGGYEAGYGPAVVDLLTPLEILVPVLGFAFGYRAILSDTTSGEHAILQTFPVRQWTYVAGVFIGRALWTIVIVFFPLLAVAGLTAVTSVETVPFYETHDAADSPILFGRFIVLTVLYTLPIVAIALAISAFAKSLWSALALTAILFMFISFGGDLLALIALERFPDLSIYLSAMTPNSAYRGLVFEHVLGASEPTAAHSVINAISIMAWTIIPVSIAVFIQQR